MRKIQNLSILKKSIVISNEAQNILKNSNIFGTKKYYNHVSQRADNRILLKSSSDIPIDKRNDHIKQHMRRQRKIFHPYAIYNQLPKQNKIPSSNQYIYFILIHFPNTSLIHNQN